MAPLRRGFLILAVSVTAWLQISSPAFGHGDAYWIMNNPNTRWCCGPRDCRPLTLDSDQVEQIDGQWYVNGQLVPSHSIYPTQGHFEYWACFTPQSDYTKPRCLFVPGAS